MSNWHKLNRTRRLSYHKVYLQNNPGAARERNRKVRAIRYGLRRHFTESEFLAKFEEQGKKCFYCGISLDEQSVTRDHYIPLVLGGTDDITNIVPACHSCNSKKRNMRPEEFIQRLGNPEPICVNGEE